MDSFGTDKKRLKTCLTCTQAKRKCDKGTPACRRCLDKGLACKYPDVPRYTRLRKQRPQPDPQASEHLVISEIPSDPADSLPIDPDLSLGQTIDEWISAELVDLEQPQTLDLSLAILAKDTPSINRCWFTGPEAWLIDFSSRFCPGELPPNHVSVLNLWIDEVREWLQEWLETGHNAFIHEQLYTYTGLPGCLQEAWSTLATYALKTKKNSLITMGILQSRADALMAVQNIDGRSAPDTRMLRTIDHLARVQALFIYQFIRLFDGNIKQRSLAEQHFGVLDEWCEQLWVSAISDPITGGASWQAGAFDETDPKAMFWGHWVLAESVRRTWYLCKILQAIYFTLRDDWAECPGSIRFTASKDLWEATSPTLWAELAKKKPLMLVAGRRDETLFTTIQLENIDAYSTLLLKLIWGPQRMKEWAQDNSKRLDRCQGLEHPLMAEH